MGAEMGWADGVSLSEFVDELKYMVEDLDNVTDEALTAGANIILAEAQNTTAWNDRTGFLRKNIKTGKIKTDKQGRKYILIGTFKRDGFYARMLEFGRSGMSAKPWLRPAFEKKRKEATDEIAKHLTEAVNRGLQGRNS
jgi:HK97 gp10 family phage protein